MQAPLGYREGRQSRTIVPTYAPGLPLLMAASLVFGACGPFLVVPVCAALFVWVTFRLGVKAGGPATGLVAAMVLAVSPVVLYQTVWPMSDVPAGAVWTAALLLALGARRFDAAGAGLLVALGLLIRPNLLPAALVVAVPLLQSGPIRERVMRLAAFGTPVAITAVFVGWLNALWFGSPLNSGYGAAGELYLWSNVLPNLKAWAAWLWQSHTPFVLLALLPVVPALRRSFNGRTLAFCCALLIAVAASYAAYAQFEVWWYLRFLLPAFGALAVLAAAGLLSVARVIPKPFGALGALAALFLFVVATISFAAGQGVFGRVRDNESRYAAIAAFAATLPEDAAFVAVQHSGSLRFQTGRLTVRFDTLEYPRSEGLIPALQRAGFHPFLVIDDAEEASLRTHLGIPAGTPLPWPIRARMRELGGVTIYDAATPTSTDGPVALEPEPRRWCEVPPRAGQR